MSDLTELLRRLPLFSAVPARDLKPVTDVAQLRSYAARAAIFASGDAADAVWALVDGTVRVYHREDDGREATVKHLASPTTFGEMEVIAGEHYLEAVQALTPCTIVVIPSAAYLAFLRAQPAAVLLALTETCKRFCIAARNERAALLSIRNRLAALLLTYVEHYGRSAPEGVQIRLALTQDDLARDLGVVPKSVTRALVEWKKAGWVTRHKGWYVVHNREALEQLSGGLRHHLVFDPKV